MKPHLLTMLAMSAVTLSSTATGFILSTGKCLAPSPCTCYSNDFVYCQGKSLTDVPMIIPTNSSEHVSSVNIDLSINRITTVPDNAFKNLSTVNTSKLYIHLNQNNIISIARNAFAGVENKTYHIDLNYNNLTSLPSALSTINSLRELDINNNPLKSLDPSVTSRLGNLLDTFKFDMVAFQSWPNELHYFKHLHSLAITDIPFKTLPLNAFSGFESSLRSLEIFRSQLQRIPPAICHLKNLKSLAFHFSTKSESNSSFFEPCQYKLVNMSDVFLDDDRLTLFPNVLHSFPNIITLTLRYNQIEFIHINTVPVNNRIVTLHLSHNRLSQIPIALNKMKSISYLFLTDNAIVTIRDNDLRDLASLINLDVSNNPIEYVAPRAFANNRLLSVVHLRNTKLTTVPLAVLSLTKLSQFPFTGNHVNCTCNMANLKVFNATKIRTIEGDCENQPGVPIAKYISTTLQGCS